MQGRRIGQQLDEELQYARPIQESNESGSVIGINVEVFVDVYVRVFRGKSEVGDKENLLKSHAVPLNRPFQACCRCVGHVHRDDRSHEEVMPLHFLLCLSHAL